MTHTLQKKNFFKNSFSRSWDFCFTAKIFFQTLGHLNLNICVEHKKRERGRKLSILLLCHKTDNCLFELEQKQNIFVTLNGSNFRPPMFILLHTITNFCTFLHTFAYFLYFAHFHLLWHTLVFLTFVTLNWLNPLSFYPKITSQSCT